MHCGLPGVDKTTMFNQLIDEMSTVVYLELVRFTMFKELNDIDVHCGSPGVGKVYHV